MAVVPVNPWHSNRANPQVAKFGYVPTQNYLELSRSPAAGREDAATASCLRLHHGHLPTGICP